MALEAQDNPFPYVTLVETADPSTPAAGTKRVWLDTDGVIKEIDESAVVSTVGAGAHAASHENGGSDEIDVTGLVGAGAPTEILSIPTAETDDTLVLAPDGLGGVEFRAESGSGASQSFIGYNTIGGTAETMTSRRVIAKQVTLATAGLLTTIDAYVDNRTAATDDQVESPLVAVLTDVAGTPGLVIGYNKPAASSILMDAAAGSGGDGTPRWLAIPIGLWLPAGTYWIAFAIAPNTNTAVEIYKDTGGSDRHYTAGGDWVADWGFYTPTTTTDRYSIRGSLITL